MDKVSKRDMYLYIAKLKDREGWRIIAQHKTLKALQEHVENQVGAEIIEFKVFKLNGAEGTIGRYFPN